MGLQLNNNKLEFTSGSGTISVSQSIETAGPSGSMTTRIDESTSTIVGAWELDSSDESSIAFRIPSSSFGGSTDRIPFYYSASGKIGIGTDNPIDEFDIKVDTFKIRSTDGTKELEFTEDGDLVGKKYGAAGASSGSELLLTFDRGTFGAETGVQNGDTMGQVRWASISGSSTGNATAAIIKVEAINVQDGLPGGHIILQSARDGITPASEDMKIGYGATAHKPGNLGVDIAGTVNIGAELHVTSSTHLYDTLAVTGNITGPKVTLTDRLKTTSITASAGISASGNVYSDNEEAYQFTFLTDSDTSNWHGPNRQGTSLYFWNYDYGDDSGVETIDWSVSSFNELTLNSGWRVPFKMEITRMYVYGHNNQNAGAGESLTFSASLLLGDPETNAPGNSSLSLTQKGISISNTGESRYAAMTASLSYTNFIVSESQYIYPRIKCTNDDQDVNGNWTIYYRRIK